MPTSSPEHGSHDASGRPSGAGAGDDEAGFDADPRTTMFFAPFLKRARALMQRPDRAAAVDELASRAQRRLHDSRDAFVMNVRARGDRLCRFVKAYGSGLANDADERNVEFAIAALVYLLSPTDIVPDNEPAGQADDAAIIAYAARTVEPDAARVLD